jgi:DNA replication protein DnaC
LVVDDLGTEMQSEKGPFAGAFQDLIRRRHADDARTVLTTNLDGKTFKTRYGARVLDRIMEKGIAFNAGNESLREKLA